MKIAYVGLDIPEGKIKYNDEILNALEKKFEPKKFTPFFAEFVKNDAEKAEAIAVSRERLLDILIPDIEKCETRLERTSDEKEKALVKKCLSQLEKELPLCDAAFSDEEMQILRVLAPLSMKPVFVCENSSPDVNTLIKNVLDKAGLTFFYTAGKPEVRSWLVKKNSDIVTCAGKIHTDLARGFIKADILNFRDLDKIHNMNDARTKGIAKVVDRDYIIQEGDIIEIRFNV